MIPIKDKFKSVVYYPHHCLVVMGEYIWERENKNNTHNISLFAIKYIKTCLA